MKDPNLDDRLRKFWGVGNESSDGYLPQQSIRDKKNSEQLSDSDETSANKKAIQEHLHIMHLYFYAVQIIPFSIMSQHVLSQINNVIYIANGLCFFTGFTITFINCTGSPAA